MMKIWMFHHVVKHTSNLDFKTCFYSLCFLCLCAQVLGQRRTPYPNCRRYKWAMQSGQISVTPSCRAQAGHCTSLSDTLVLQEDFQNFFLGWVPYWCQKTMNRIDIGEKEAGTVGSVSGVQRLIEKDSFWKVHAKHDYLEKQLFGFIDV